MRASAAVSLIGALWAGAARAAAPPLDDGDLEPARSIFDSRGESNRYRLEVAEALGVQTRPVVQMVVLPSFQPERLVFVESAEERAVVVSRRLRRQLWSERYNHFSEPSPDPRPKFIERVKPLDAEAARLVQAAWFAAIWRAHHQKDRLPLDGVDYEFSVRGESGVHSATTWCPPEGTVAADLVVLGELLEAYAAADPPDVPTFRAKLAGRARALLKRLDVPELKEGP